MRLNISVPDDLAERVRARELPISSICQDALRKAVELAEQKEKIMTDIDRVVARLRETVDDERKLAEEDGRQAGASWAKEVATARQLETVAEGEIAGFEALYRDEEDLSFRDWWERLEVQNRGTYTDGFAEGFVEGAREVWEAVADKL